jgi:hypothetical protein
MKPLVLDGPPLRRPTLHDIWRVCEDYRRAFGHYPNLLRPRLLTEKVQWRKLFDRNPLFAVLCDKIAVRDFIASRVDEEFLPEVLWIGDRPQDIPFGTLDPPYVLKATHGSSYNVFVPDRHALDADKARDRLRQYLAENFGRAIDEPGYLPVRPRLLAERMLVEPDGSPPVERKVWVFDGRVRLIQSLVFEQGRRWLAMHDPGWTALDWISHSPPYRRPLPRPARFEQIIALAEQLGSGLDFVRVDMYDWTGGTRIGELSIYQVRGLHRFHPAESDAVLGSYWRLPRPMRRALAAVLTA